MLADDEVKNLLSRHLDIHYGALKADDDDWKKFKEQITFNTQGGSESQSQQPGSFLRVPFKEALTLVGKRSVFLHKGIAYVPISQL